LLRKSFTQTGVLLYGSQPLAEASNRSAESSRKLAEAPLRPRNFCFQTLLASAVLVLALCGTSPGQTYQVNSNSGEPPSAKKSKAQSADKSLGWGSNIQNARLAHAAEEAIRSRNYPAAVDYAQRAAQSAPGDAHLWFLLGYAARLAGKSQLAVDAYTHGLRVAPSSLEGMSGLAQTYKVMGRRDEAQSLLTRVVAADPRRTEDLLLLGEIFLQAGQYEQALPPLQRAEQVHPDARSELLLALAYERTKQFKEASRYLDMAKRRSPDNPEVLRTLASFYRESGNYAAAVATLKAIRGGSPDLKAELAYSYQLAGKPADAAKLYAQAADAAPRNVDLQLSAAQAEVGAGAMDAAKGFLKRAAGLNANHYRLHAVRGEMARLEERNRDAVEEYSAALRNLPEAPPEGPLYAIQLHMHLVELYQRLHAESEAQSQLRIAQSKISNLDIRGHGRADFLRLRALIKLHEGETESALADINEALALNAKDPNSLQLNGDLLAKLGRHEEAIGVYKKVLDLDPANRLALTSLGSASREMGRDRDAEKYFRRLAVAYPRLYVPYLALGDMYTARRDFAKAEAEYQKGYSLAPKNALIVAGGMNAAIEAHKFPLAAEWLARATPEMQEEPLVLREKERYLTWTGKYQESAQVGEEAIKKLPMDRDVVVYLGYDLLHLERYDELLQLTSRYEERMPKQPALPLLAGYVHKHAGDLEQAEAAFTRALDRDPKVPTAWVNRGFVRHDLHQGAAAASDFQAALKLEPKNGEAHLGLAYASLDLRHSHEALRQAKLAEEQLGDSMALHLIRGTAYGYEGMLKQAAGEYRLALKSAPNDGNLHLALANSLYGLHQYAQAIGELQAAEKLLPNNSAIYAQLARSYAQLGDRARTLQYVQLAESTGPDTVFVSTAEALLLIGDGDAATQRLERGLMAPNSDRIAVRLVAARLMLDDGQQDDARRQIALALMEAASGRTLPPTGNQLMEAADLFLGMHDYQLAETYFQRALAAGAPETEVRIGLANTYLALGDTPRAGSQLAFVSPSKDGSEASYQYLLAKANLLRQEHHSAQALTAFAQAAEAAGQDLTAEQEMLRAGGEEGLRINRRVSFRSDFSIAPIFEDTTVYALDAALLGAGPGTLPLPRSSLETQWTGAYHLHLSSLPEAGGFFQVRHARGDISLPSANRIVSRDTTDYSFNFALNPTLRLGNNVLTFSTGIQETVRRDSADPFDMNQNLFRQFVYLSTSSFFNWLSVKGYAIRESGPFTLNNLSSRDLAGHLEFRVGRPWGKRAFITGWGARDEQFSPVNREFYYTSTYAGVEQQISGRLRLRAVGEYLRAWRVEGSQFAIAQAFRPAGSVEYSPARNWALEASVAYSRNMGIHAYDAVQSGFGVSYAMPFRRAYEENGHRFPLRYPIRFSAGLQQETFFNFTGGKNQQFRPFVSVNIF
jgi:tetratricopeptide (TPR) repeat protein